MFNLEKKAKTKKHINIVKEPNPVMIQENGKKCWEIKSIKHDIYYRIWADTYQQALELLPMIESF